LSCFKVTLSIAARPKCSFWVGFPCLEYEEAALPAHDRNELRVGTKRSLAKTLQIFAPDLCLTTEQMNMPRIACAMACFESCRLVLRWRSIGRILHLTKQIYSDESDDWRAEHVPATHQRCHRHLTTGVSMSILC
jgi:hypothetical protein